MELHPSRQQGHQKRGEGYHPTMISRRVEISITAGGGGMVCADLLIGTKPPV